MWRARHPGSHQQAYTEVERKYSWRPVRGELHCGSATCSEPGRRLVNRDVDADRCIYGVAAAIMRGQPTPAKYTRAGQAAGDSRKFVIFPGD
jgi:hypothetical protein